MRILITPWVLAAVVLPASVEPREHQAGQPVESALWRFEAGG
jgi:hypothetical protein